MRLGRLVTSAALAAAAFLAGADSPGGAPSVPTGRLAFVDVRVDSDLFLTSADGTGERRLIRDLVRDVAPSLAPDGRTVAFSRAGDLETLDLETGERRRLTTTSGVYDTDPAWAPDGSRIAWSRGGQIWVMEADGSETRQLTDRANFAAQPDWSPDGRRIAYALGGSHVATVGLDGSERVFRFTVMAGRPRWSPDGRRLVYVRRWSAASAKSVDALAVVDVEREQDTGFPLTADGKHRTAPDWLADGRIAFWMAGDLYAASPAGGGIVPLTRSGAIAPDWSGDETRIVFAREIGSKPQLYDIGLDGTGLRRLSELPATAPSYSPDGRLLAFVGTEDCQSAGLPVRRCRLYVMDADGGPPRRVAWTTSLPTWSPTGRHLAFQTGRWIATVGLDGRGARRVRGTGRYDWWPDWSPRGRFLAFVRTRGDDAFEIRRVVAWGGRTRLLRRGAREPDWSPDGRRIAFTNTYAPTYGVQVWTMRADGTGARRLTRGSLIGSSPRWSPDGRYLAYVRRGEGDTRTGTGTSVIILRADGRIMRRLVGLTSDASVVIAWRVTE